MAQQTIAALPTADIERPTILVVGRKTDARTLRWLRAAPATDANTVFLPLLSGDTDPEEGVPVSDASALAALGGSKFGIWSPGTETSGSQSRRRTPSVAKLARIVSSAIASLRPAHLHASDIGIAGLAVAAVARKGNANLPTVSVSNWHGDLAWYAGLPQHHEGLQQLMRMAGLFAPEGGDDARIALQLGFGGKLSVPAPGPEFTPGTAALGSSPSRRRDVVFDCRHTFPLGEAHLLSAAFLAAIALKPFRIRLVGADDNPGPMLELLKSLGLDVEPAAIPSDGVAAAEILATARLFVGARVSDMAGLNLVAAMQAGAFPVMTDAENAADWVRAGQDALIGSHHDVANTAANIERALGDDALIDMAAARNVSVVSRPPPRTLRDYVRQHYADVCQRSEGVRTA